MSFREKHYTDSHRQFTELLKQTDGSRHLPQLHFIEYKLMLADLLDGIEKPALDFIAEHRGEEPPPLAWYYLNAALDFRHGRAAQGEAWLQQAGASYPPSAGQLFAESFDSLGWSAHGIAPPAPAREQAHEVALAQATRKERRPISPPPSAKTLAVVELLPSPERQAATRVTIHERGGRRGAPPDVPPRRGHAGGPTGPGGNAASD